MKSKHWDVSTTATIFKFSFACEVCPSSGQTDSFAPKQHFPFRHVPRSRLHHGTHLTCACGAMWDFSIFCYTFGQAFTRAGMSWGVIRMQPTIVVKFLPLGTPSSIMLHTSKHTYFAPHEKGIYTAIIS